MHRRSIDFSGGGNCGGHTSHRVCESCSFSYRNFRYPYPAIYSNEIVKINSTEIDTWRGRRWWWRTIEAWMEKPQKCAAAKMNLENPNCSRNWLLYIYMWVHRKWLFWVISDSFVQPQIQYCFGLTKLYKEAIKTDGCFLPP
jgi:hypothetical protein